MPSGGWLQSSPAIPGLGFCLGTRAQMFWLEEGLASSLAPRRRPRTTLSPGIVMRDGKPYLAFGSPGGDSQDQWALTFFLAHVHHGLDLQAAIDAPTFHTEHFPSSFHPRRAFPRRVHVEDRVRPEVIAELRRRGHDIQLEPGWSLGHLCAVGRDHVTGMLMAGATSRDGVSFALGR
jgi:gamma-glutamyltranspeptidase / glutathione hydrolase